ncbi:MAG: SpoIIE family protein phosphatase [Streptosporangiales bacterium]|nr:SpoIIE family protein phosphatase [Streptosporangiales bacterium]
MTGSPPRSASHLTQLGTFMLDRAGHITHWSAGAELLFGRPAADVLGQDVQDLLSGDQAPEAVEEALAEISRGRTWTGVLGAECADGQVQDVRFRLEPLLGAGSPSLVIVNALVVPDDARTAPGEGVAWEGLALLHEASARIGSTLDLSQTASEIMDVAVPRFAHAAGVFALEYLVAEDEYPPLTAGGSVDVRRLAIRVADGEPQRWSSVFPADEVVVHSAATPYARCLATGKPILFDLPMTEGADHPGHREIVRRLRTYSPFLAVPLRARGRALGFLVFGRRRGDRPFGAQDVDLAEELAARAAVCIDNARLYRRERHTARALQESLLPRQLTAPPGLEIAHRYLPASDVTQLGGDWYDAIPLSDGRVALVVGDAMGHGSVAAAAMVQLRTAVRTLASLHLPPADTLYRLDRLAAVLESAQFATCVFVTCDPVTRSCVVARAGHVPPLLLHPDGTTTVLEVPAGLPLGVGGAAFESARFEIPPGGALVLYTDGLVESRERDLDSGIAALRAALARPRRTLQATCDAIIQALPARQANNGDDVTVLLVRPSGSASPGG